MTALPRARMKPRHVQPLWAGHPWVFAQAIGQLDGEPGPGDEVDVLDPAGNILGRALYSPGSAIPLRLYSTRAGQAFDAEFVRDRLRAALDCRRAMGLPDPATSGYRWVHGEGDELPGLILDRLGDVVVMQCGTVGVHRRRGVIADVVEELVGPLAILDRTSPRMAAAEGFPVPDLLVRGTLPDCLRFRELGFDLQLPLSLSQKTGYYFDQRPLRRAVERMAAGRQVLDCHCFVGSVSLAAARGGATSVVGVDRSGPALNVAAAHARAHGLEVDFRSGDALEALTAAASDPVDLVIVDPPKLAPQRSARDRALKAMRRLAAAACRAVRPGGTAVVSSCSAAVGLDDVTRATALGARDAGRRAVVVERLHQGADHPVPAAFPEGLYLATVVVRVDDRT